MLLRVVINMHISHFRFIGIAFLEAVQYIWNIWVTLFVNYFAIIFQLVDNQG